MPEALAPPPLDVVAVVDNTNPDNMFQVLALMSQKDFNLLGVVVTGRAASDRRDAKLLETSKEESEFRTILNAVRMRNFMDIVRPNHSIPVWAGTPAPETIVPHSVHVDELEFNDLQDGQLEAIQASSLRSARQLGALGLAGNITTAKKYLASDAIGKFVLMVGGPMTDVAKLLRDPSIADKITEIHTQFGMCGFGEQKLMEFDGETPRGKRQFNVACDVRAAHEVLMRFPGDIYLYPSDVTRVDKIGFKDGDELRSFLQSRHRQPGVKRMADIYDFAFNHMIKPRGEHEKIWIHDFAPVAGGLNSRRHRPKASRHATGIRRGPYHVREIVINNVPHKERERTQFGEIHARYLRGTPPQTHRRFVAYRVHPVLYKRALKDLTRGPGPLSSKRQQTDAS